MCRTSKYILSALLILPLLGAAGAVAAAEEGQNPGLSGQIIVCLHRPEDSVPIKGLLSHLGEAIPCQDLQQITGKGVGFPQAAKGPVQSARIILWDEAYTQGTPGLEFSDQGKGMARNQTNTLNIGGK